MRLVQEPLARVLGRDAAGAEAALHTYRDVEVACRLLRRALLLGAAAHGRSGREVRRLATMRGADSFGRLVSACLLNQAAVVLPSPCHLRAEAVCRRQILLSNRTSS